MASADVPVLSLLRAPVDLSEVAHEVLVSKDRSIRSAGIVVREHPRLTGSLNY